jgi:cytochrome c biogenesis protein CcmG/thiol:disulfide interchange protein DsbE
MRSIAYLTRISLAAGAILLCQAATKPAPDFTLKDSNGAAVKLSAYKGKVVLLDFWETSCAPCRVEIPWLVEFEKTFKDRGFAVLGVSMDEDGWGVVKPFMQQHGMNYRVLLGDEKAASLYGGVEALPTTLLIDRSGQIASTHIGLSSSKEAFRSEIERLLNAR